MSQVLVFSVVMAVVILVSHAREIPSSNDNVAKAVKSVRALSEQLRNAAASNMKRSEKRGSCSEFAERCGWMTSCCDGFECIPDNTDFFSDGTCWMKA